MSRPNRLKDENVLFERFFTISLDLLCIADIEGTFVKLNKAWEKVLGYTVDELKGKKIWEFVHPDDIAVTLNVLLDLRKQKQVLDFTNRYKCKDGSYRYLEWRCQPYDNMNYATARDITDKIEKQKEMTLELFKNGTTGIVRDIAARKDIINYIEAQKNFFKQMLNTIPDLIFYKDTSSTYLGCNKAFAENFIGVKEEEIIGKTDLDFVKDKELARLFMEKDKEMLEDGETKRNEERIKMADNSIMQVETLKTPFYDENGKIAGLIGISRDISLRKSIEEKLRSSEEKFRLLFENMTNCFSLHEVILDNKGEPVDFRFIMVNKAYEMQMNLRLEDIVGKTILEVNPKADKEMIKKYCEVGITGNPLHIEYFSKTFNRYFSVCTYSFQKGMFASVFEDITERKKAEGELEESRKSAEAASIMKSNFLANMSHEIRTPMNGILGFLNLIQKTNLSSEQEEYIREAKTASDMLLYLINDILDFSKIEAGKLTVEKISFMVRKVARDAVSFLVPKAVEKHVEFYMKIKSNVPEEVIGDPSRLRQILNNLISNAIKFTEKGKINVTIDCINRFDGKALLIFEVKDTGIGISENDVKELFRPFTQADASTTRKFGGTGLGLAISMELVRLMDGDISVESELGKGSTFKFSILLEISKKPKSVRRDEIINFGLIALALKSKNKEDAQIIKRYTVKEQKEEFQPKILLVEDNEMNRKLVVKILKQHDMICDIAVNGAEAVKAVVQKEYDIVFMDCQMPVMDGYESTAQIREIEGNKKHTIIIAMTADAMESDRKRCIKAGMDDHISKPIDFDIMFNMISANRKVRE